MSEELESALGELIGRKQRHMDLAKATMDAMSGSFFAIDLLVWAALNRSLQLTRGFRHQVADRNFLCAAPLVRMQLDNALRISALRLSDDADDLAFTVMKGTPVRRLRDRSGSFMTDRHLVEELSKRLPWVESVYEKTSAFVHLSDQHIFSLFPDTPRDHVAPFRISADEDDIPLTRYLEAVQAFGAATDALLEMAEEWAKAKKALGESSNGGE